MAYAGGDNPSGTPLGLSEKHYQSDGCLDSVAQDIPVAEIGEGCEELISSTGGRRTTSLNKVPLSLYQAQNVTPDNMVTTRRAGCDSDNCHSNVPASPEPNISEIPPFQLTSTPIQSGSMKRTPATCDYDVSKEQVRFSASCKSDDDSLEGSAGNLQAVVSDQSRGRGASVLSVLDPTEISVPIRGYEIMEQRARFTVFKIQVCRSAHDSWYVFRRYTDFVQLNDRLGGLFPGFRLALPPKKWFGDNFDPIFLEDRTLGLQAFVDNITGHKDVCNSAPVRDFFCFDDPPGPHDSLEESRSLCEALEEQVYNTKKLLQEREAEISILSEERDMYRAQVEALQRSLRVERTLNSKVRQMPLSPSSDTSLAECDQPTEAKVHNSDHAQATTGSEKAIADDPARATSPESGIGEGTVTTLTQELPTGGATLLSVPCEQNVTKAKPVPEMS